MYTNVVYFNHSKGKAAKDNADKGRSELRKSLISNNI